jgi:pyrroloquinoline-quinone synthase
MTTEQFLQRLDAVIEQHAMLSHPFYQEWNAGTLSADTLREYAKQYYAHVRAFPAYVSAVHSHSDDIAVRQMLLENLIEEEQGDENHPELWMRFADGLGVDRNDVRNATLLPHTTASVNTLKSVTHSEDAMEGIAALYAYESQIPAVALTKREGLQKFYGIDAPRAVSFFRVHEHADVIHRQVERDILSTVTDEARQERIIAAAEKSAKALWHFLDGVKEAYC